MRLYLNKIVFLIAFLCLSGARESKSQSVERVDSGYVIRLNSTLSIGPTFRELIVDDYDGDVDIESNSGDKIVIRESIFVRADSEDEARELSSQLSTEVTKARRTVMILGRGDSSRGRGREISISVPVYVAVSVSLSFGDIILDGSAAPANLTTGSGDITVTDIDASIDLETGAGDISAIAISGAVSVQSGSGDVEIHKANSRVDVVTGGGEIELVDISGPSTATTGGGEISGRRLSGDLTFLTAGGDLELSFIEGSMSLKTSGGSIDMNEIIGNVRVTTAGGDIRGNHMTGYLVAETLAGDVELLEIDGNLKVVSQVGDIDVTLKKGADSSWDRVDLRAENGDVDLVLPAGTAIDLRVDLGYGGKLDMHDFAGELIWTKTTRSREDGQIRRGTAILNGGGAHVDVSSGSGRITISDH